MSVNLLKVSKVKDMVFTTKGYYFLWSYTTDLKVSINTKDYQYNFPSDINEESKIKMINLHKTTYMY